MATKAQNKLIAEVQPMVDAATTAEAARVRVWERRQKNPGMTTGPSIRLKVPGFEIRWVLTSRQGRFHQAIYDQGWEPVRPDELDGSILDLGLSDQQDGKVRRGPKGEEILVKMPSEVFEKIRQRKGELNTQKIKKTKKNLQEALGNAYGDEAAEFAGGKSRIEETGVGPLRGNVVDSVGTES